MITYDSRNWFKALALHRSDTFRKLFPLLILVGLFTMMVGYLEVRYMQLSSRELVSNLPVMHSILGFAITMIAAHQRLRCWGVPPKRRSQMSARKTE